MVAMHAASCPMRMSARWRDGDNDVTRHGNAVFFIASLSAVPAPRWKPVDSEGSNNDSELATLVAPWDTISWTSALCRFTPVVHCMPAALRADAPGTIAEGLWPRRGVLQLLLHLYGVETPNRGILRKS